MSERRPYEPMPDPRNVLGYDNADDLRARVRRDQDAYHAERRAQLAAQTSIMSTPQERIALWERLHSLRLPTEPGHKLLEVIAAQTQLSIEQLTSEQRRRAELSTAARR